MFWKTLGWVTAACIVAVGLLAFVTKGGGEAEKGEATPEQSADQPAKKFNF